LLHSFSIFFLFTAILNYVLIGGGDNQRVTPVPIPNTEVKSLDADGTAGVAQWESRLLPPFFFIARWKQRAFYFFVIWYYKLSAR
jgi:hypothetical protein